MLEAIGAILPFGVGVALSPVPIIAVILMLVSAKARVNGPMFIVGWLVGLAVVGIIVLAVAGPADASDDGQPADWIAIVELVLAGTAIAQTGIDGAEQAVAYAVFALIATIGVAVPVVVYFSLGDRAPAMLHRLQDWMAQNNAVIMSVLILVIGVKVLGDGLGKL